MIEARVVPTGRAVAVFTLLPASTVVSVIAGMAAVAGRRSVLESLVFVAGEALGFLVESDQRKPRHVMIKFDVEPAGR